jgi:RNA 3'-terminal phosphate cyclase (ATP)
MIEIDGSLGEGGGQVLRTALTLSVLTGKSFRIDNIRGNRSQPGLKNQHLTALRAAGTICGAEIEGDRLKSQKVVFRPGEIRSGSYQFEIPTAGSAALVLQTLLLPLSRAEGSSRVSVVGGTHVPWSPCYHYLAWQWLPALKAIGFDADLGLDRAGYYPRGGGRITARIEPGQGKEPLEWLERGEIKEIRGLSGVSNLPVKIAQRQREQVVRSLGSSYPLNDIRAREVAAGGKGTFIALQVACEGGRACFFSLGRPGKPAERVGQEAADQVQSWVESGGAVDRFLSDQLLIPLALARGQSRIRVPEFTSHLKTNAVIISHFLDVKFAFQEESRVLAISPTGQD